MKPQIRPWRRLGAWTSAIALMFAVGSARPSTAHHPLRLRASSVYRSEWGAATVTPSTDPARLASRRDWRRSVPATIPRFEKVNPGPFAVWQDRRFERGETLVPAGGQVF